MDAIKGFFQKYGAVPATRSGPVWSAATGEALAVWAEGDAATWDADPSARPHLRSRMLEVRNESWRRLQLYPEVALPDQPPAYRSLLRVWDRMCVRVGIGPG
jgi:hypothetical protein